MRRFSWPLGLAALLLSPCVASAQLSESPLSPIPLLTLEQAQALAAARSPELHAAQLEVQASEGAVQQAGARPNPSLSATVEDTRSQTRTTTTTLGFPLELGGKRMARIGAAERSRELAGAQLAQASAKVRADVVAAYVVAVVAQERVTLAGDSLALASRASEVAGKRVMAGKASPVDATRARVDAANAGLELAEARSALQSASQALAATWGATAPHFAGVDNPVGDVPTRGPAADLLSGLDAAPALVADRIEIERRQAGVAVERSKGVPDVVVTAGVKRDNDLGRTQAVIGFSVPLPLFDRNQGAVLEASRRAEKARDDYAAARVRLAVDLSRAATDLDTARTSLQMLRDTVLPAAQQAYDSATIGFEAGKFAFLDVIDAQRALLQARARYLTTLSTAWQAATTIDRLLGR